MRRAGWALVVVGALWLAVLILLPVYVEPGNGSIRCGRAWQAARIEDFLRSDCHHAIQRRRATLVIPTVLVGVGTLVVVLARRRNRGVEDEGLTTWT